MDILIIVSRSFMTGHNDIETCIFLTIQVQLDYVIEDFEYTKWLDPDPEVAAYAKNDSEETVGNL